MKGSPRCEFEIAHLDGGLVDVAKLALCQDEVWVGLTFETWAYPGRRKVWDIVIGGEVGV